MINFKLITRAIEDILAENTDGYTIERDAMRNVDPNVAAKGKGWINITKGPVNYESYTIGNTPWLCDVQPKVEIQYADNEGYKCEDGLEDALEEILGILASSDYRTLSGTVQNVRGFKVEYDINDTIEAYHQAAIITIFAEVRT
jgi:hypothetical protein